MHKSKQRNEFALAKGVAKFSRHSYLQTPVSAFGKCHRPETTLGLTRAMSSHPRWTIFDRSGWTAAVQLIALSTTVYVRCVGDMLFRRVGAAELWILRQEKREEQLSHPPTPPPALLPPFSADLLESSRAYIPLAALSPGTSSASTSLLPHDLLVYYLTQQLHSCNIFYSGL